MLAVLLPAGSVTDETIGRTVDVSQYENLTVIVESSSGTASGVVTIETAVYEEGASYRGTWAEVEAITVPAASTQSFTQLPGAPGNAMALKYLRARISTVIGSGTITCWLVAN
jgi:hypothetical protein